MANDTWEARGAAFGRDLSGDAPDAIEKAQAIPGQAVGSNLGSASDLSGYSVSLTERRLNLVGTQRFDKYEELLRDVTIIATGVRLFLNLVANAIWTVNPPENLSDNEKAVAQGYADQAYDMLFDMTTPWSTVVKKIAMGRMIGFAILEWTAKHREDGAIGLLDIEHRPQRSITRWIRDASGTVEGVVQTIPGLQPVELPRSKIVYFVDDTLTDSPEGTGLFRHLAETADRLAEFLRLEEIGFSTDLRGIPIARAPLGEMRAEVEAAGLPDSPERKRAEARRILSLKPLRDFVTNHIRNKQSGVTLPSDVFTSSSTDKGSTPSSTHKWGLELLNGEASSFDAMAKAIERMNRELARVLGIEHVLLGSDGGGSLALARSKVGTFFLTVTSTLQDIVEVCDSDVIAPIADLNNWPDHLRPQMGVNEISDRDIEQVMTALKDLATAGAPLLSDDPAVGEVYDLLGLTRPPVRVDDADLSLTPDRNAPTNPNDPDQPLARNPEDEPIAKTIRSRRNMAKRLLRRR